MPQLHLHSKIEENRIRIEVNIVWKSGCTFGCTGAPPVHLHAPKSIGFFTPIPKLHSECEVNRLRFAVMQDRLETRVRTLGALQCTYMHRKQQASSQTHTQTIFQIVSESDKNCGQDPLETRMHLWVHPGFQTILTAILIRFTSNLEYSLGLGL